MSHFGQSRGNQKTSVVQDFDKGIKNNTALNVALSI